MSKTAFITGITGQDGSILARLLLEKGYQVHGLVRWDAMEGTQRLNDIKGKINLHHGDVTDANNITALLNTIRPQEIYNLAALSHVGVSFDTPSSVFDINAKGSLNIFESVRILGFKTRIYQASSSEMFGASAPPQNEKTPMQPCSPYGVAKLAAYHLAKIYRESYGLFISNGILFNHESAERGTDFVTRKIAKAVAAIESGQQDILKLGNLEARRDWGHAKDYVRGMWTMLQQDKPDDFVLASGESYSVREFAVRAFEHIGVKIVFSGEGKNEIGKDAKTGKTVIAIDESIYRINEVHSLRGDASKAWDILGWKPEISFDQLLAEMVNAERQCFNLGKESAWKMVG